MSNARLRELELRRRSLQLRSERQRRAIAAEGADIGARIGSVERKASLAGRLLSRPALGIGAIVLLAVAGPSRALRWASRALVGLTLVRRAAVLLGTFPGGTGSGDPGSIPPGSRRE